MAKVFFKSLLLGALTLVLMPFLSHAQFNPLQQYRNIINSDFHYSTVNSAIKPTVISQPSYGKVIFSDEAKYENVYEFEYSPGDIEANTQAIIEYWTQDSETGELKPDYTTFYFRISKSLIRCTDDYEEILTNEEIIGIDVLGNDAFTDGPLNLESIASSIGGTATINENTIDFVPEIDFDGLAYIYYIVSDTTGKKAKGKLKVNVINYEAIPEYEEINIHSYGGEEIVIDLPYSGFEAINEIQFGSFINENGISKYVPTANINGSESFTLVHNNITRKVNVWLFSKDRPNSWVIDDIVYTSVGTPVEFNVTKNDLKKNQEVVDYSPEITKESEQGLFSYIPDPYFSGAKEFEYTVYNGYETETGQIHLKVNNFFPQTQYDYNFNSLSNTVLVIDYRIPIENYSFEIIEGPQNGSVFINSGTAVINLGCTEVFGTNLVLYEPDFNFVGSDRFVLNYCIDENCSEVEISVDIKPNNLDGCKCYTGCVWAGDANNDGLVNAVDLLAMSYALGTSGEEAEEIGSSDWVGKKTENWSYSTIGGVNAKYADSDGNGLVDETDFDAILENYDKNHALVPPQLLSSKSYPFSLTPSQATFYPGDLVTFEIGIGNELFPALDVYGFAYSLGMPPNIVDSASVQLSYYHDSWLSIDEAIKGISKQIRDGWIETSVARLGKRPKSGAGELGKLDFIVEEDIVGGFRVSDGIIPVTVYIEEAMVLTADGQIAKLEGTEATVYIDLKDRQSDNEALSKLIAYPNPAQDVINLHMNGGHEILSYEVYDLMGQRIATKQVEEGTRNVSINLSNLHNGSYVVKAQTSFGPRVQKIEVIK